MFSVFSVFKQVEKEKETERQSNPPPPNLHPHLRMGILKWRNSKVLFGSRICSVAVQQNGVGLTSVQCL